MPDETAGTSRPAAAPLTALDACWRQAHPLPDIGDGADKNARGRALLVAGSATVPGGPLLTGEALLRAGAGKVRIGTIAAAAMAIGALFPEAAIVPLATDESGEIAAEAAAALEKDVGRCDVLVMGPATMARPHSATLVETLLRATAPETSILLDAGALVAMHGKAAVLARCGGRLLLTPHHGELATLLGCDEAEITAAPVDQALRAARLFGAAVVLKARETIIADPSGTLLHYCSDAPGLGTAGSGDVLAGVIGGLLARGMDPLSAAGWGVWIHGEAGKMASRTIGRVGFLARDLLPLIPALVAPHG